MVIDRYRETTAALGYTGDSIINSLSDIAMMGSASSLARKLPVRVAVALLIALELVPLFVIRDNLALNISTCLRRTRRSGVAGRRLAAPMLASMH